MPFTVSHAAAVLPLSRTRLPLAALAVGALVPDLPYYLPVPGLSAHLTHTPAGLGADLALGAGALVVVRLVLRAPLLALAPLRVRARIPAAPPALTARHLALSAVALVIGALTHLAWDAFTQTGGAAVVAWPVLDTPVVGPHRLYNVLMYASSALGLVALAGWTRRWYRRAGRRGPRSPGVAAPVRARTVAVVLVGTAALTGAVLMGLSPRAAASGYDLVRSVVLGLVRGAGVGLACYALAWHAREATHRSSRSSRNPSRT